MDLQRCLVLSVSPQPSAIGSNNITTPSFTGQSTDASLSVRARNPGIFSGIGVNTFTALSDREDDISITNSSNTNTAPSQPTTAPSMFVSTARRSFLEVCENIATELNTAMREESLTIDYMHSVPASMTGPVQSLGFLTGGSGGGGGAGRGGSSGSHRAPDGLIDIGFIRDLHCATVQLMVSCGTPIVFEYRIGFLLFWLSDHLIF